MVGTIMFLPPQIVIRIFLISLVAVRGEAVLNPDGSITLPTENITVSEHQSDMILTANITLPDDTVSVGNVMVFAYSDDDIGGRLLSHPVNTSGTTRASPEAQMVRKFKLETANVTLTSQLTKNSTTNRFKVRAVFKIALSSSTLYLQSLMIRKILFVVTSYGQDDRRNEKQYLIFYSKSVIVPSPLVLSNASSVADSTVRKPISVVPSPVRSTVALSSSVVRETDKPPVTDNYPELCTRPMNLTYVNEFLTEKFPVPCTECSDPLHTTELLTDKFPIQCTEQDTED